MEDNLITSFLAGIIGGMLSFTSAYGYSRIKNSYELLQEIKHALSLTEKFTNILYDVINSKHYDENIPAPQLSEEGFRTKFISSENISSTEFVAVSHYDLNILRSFYNDFSGSELKNINILTRDRIRSVQVNNNVDATLVGIKDWIDSDEHYSLKSKLKNIRQLKKDLENKPLIKVGKYLP